MISIFPALMLKSYHVVRNLLITKLNNSRVNIMCVSHIYVTFSQYFCCLTNMHQYVERGLSYFALNSPFLC